MKKIFILSAIILLLNGYSFAEEPAQEPIKASVSMSDLLSLNTDTLTEF